MPLPRTRPRTPGRALQLDNVAALGQFETNAVVPSFVEIVIAQLRAQPRSFHAYDGIDRRVKIRSAVEYLDADGITFQALGISRESFLHEVAQQVALALGLGKSGTGEHLVEMSSRLLSEFRDDGHRVGLTVSAHATSPLLTVRIIPKHNEDSRVSRRK